MLNREINGISYTVGEWPLDAHRSTLVFVHGAGGSSQFWQSQTAGFKNRVNTVAIDLPGHGRTEGPARGRVEDYAQAVIELTQGIDIPNPIPCGLSLGGAITLQLLLDHPDLFKAGILINTGAKLKVSPEIIELLEKDFKGYLEMIGELVASKSMDSKILSLFKDQTAHCNPEVILEDFQACNRFDVMQRLSAIALPVLVVSAKDDRLAPPKYGEFLKDQIPNANWVLIAGAGHILPMEKPEELNSAIKNFLDGADL